MTTTPRREHARFRITLDLTITVDESNLLTGNTQEEQEYNTRQQRLLHAVTRDSAIIVKVQQYLLASHFECMDARDWHSLLRNNATTDTDTFLLPAIETLSEDDQLWFAEAKQEDVFFECTQEFLDCFSVTLDDVRNVEVKG